MHLGCAALALIRRAVRAHLGCAALPLIGSALAMTALACASADRRPAPSPPDVPPPFGSAQVERPADAGARAVRPSADAATTAPCLVVHGDDDEAERAEIEGVLTQDEGGAFVLRLESPRCVIGLRGSAFVADVQIASTGFDLRPLRGARLRATGEALASTSSFAGPAVVVLVRDVERLPARTTPLP